MTLWSCYLSCLLAILPSKGTQLKKKKAFLRFYKWPCYGSKKENDTPFHLLPANFCWWDVSCFFKHRLQNSSHVVSCGIEGNDCSLAGKAVSEYGMNMSVKHTTLRSYGPRRELVPLMKTCVADKQRKCHITMEEHQNRWSEVIRSCHLCNH